MKMCNVNGEKKIQLVVCILRRLDILGMFYCVVLDIYKCLDMHFRTLLKCLEVTKKCLTLEL